MMSEWIVRSKAIKANTSRSGHTVDLQHHVVSLFQRLWSRTSLSRRSTDSWQAMTDQWERYIYICIHPGPRWNHQESTIHLGNCISYMDTVGWIGTFGLVDCSCFSCGSQIGQRLQDWNIDYLSGSSRIIGFRIPACNSARNAWTKKNTDCF